MITQGVSGVSRKVPEDLRAVSGTFQGVQGIPEDLRAFQGGLRVFQRYDEVEGR